MEANKKIIILTIFLLLISLTLSITKIEFILSAVNSKEINLETARVSAYITSLFSVIINIIILVLICILTKIVISSLNIEMENDIYLNGSTYFLIVFVFFEIIKIVLLLFIFQNSIKHITIDSNIQENLKKTEWFQLNQFIEYFSLFIAIFGMSYSIYQDTKSIKFSIHVFLIMIFLFLITLLMF